MRVHTKLVYEWHDGAYVLVAEEGYDYSGAVALACGSIMGGPTNDQKALASKETNWADQMSQQATSLFGTSSKVFQSILDQFTPIMNAGPNQEGFNQAEKTAMNSQVSEGTAQTYNHASQALNENISAAGGGNTYIPAGANNQLREDLASKAAQTESNQKLNIVQQDYAQGRQNWMDASKMVLGAPSVMNQANEATRGVSDAYKNAADQVNKNASEQTSWLGAIGGVLGQVAGGISGAGVGGALGQVGDVLGGAFN